MIAARRSFLDIQTVQSRGFFERGIPRYATQLSLGLLRAGVDVAGLGLNPTQPYPRHLPPELAQAPHLTWNTAAALRDAQREGPILYHVLSVFERPDVRPSALPSHVVGTGIPIVCQVYDLIPDVTGLLEPGSDEERFHRVRNRVLAGADLLLALSERTRLDVIERLDFDPERVAVVGAATSDFFRPPRDDEQPRELLARELPRLTRPFLLTVSAWAPHKNTELALDAFAALPSAVRSSLQLVVACTLPAEGLIQWEAHAASVGLDRDEVVFTGFVTDEVLRALYQTTELCVYPSRYEGFGLPVLEAAWCGSLAITSNRAPLTEVLDWPPATFDPDDAGALAALIERALHDEQYRTGLRSAAEAATRRHTWDGVVQRTVAAYEKVDAPSVRRRPRQAPLRVALVGPFPPVRSGVARYNFEVASRLVEHCELDCFVDACDWVHEDIRHELPASRVQSVGPRRPRGSAAGWFPAHALGRTIDPARYDSVVYTIGNSWFHHDTLGLARRYPGIVWFHDVDLVGLYITYADRLLTEDPDAAVEMFRDLLARYGARAHDLPVTLADRRWANYEPYRRSGLCLAIELACDSRTSIVTSQLAKKLLELDAGPMAPLAPIEVLALAVPRRRNAPRPDTTIPLVVTLGRQEDAKQPEMLIDAIAILNRSRPVRLAIVGEIRPDHRTRLRHRIATHGLENAVDVTGFVTDREYQAWINRSACAVQLREHSTGEGSAAVADALAAGVPVATNIPSCLELPDGTLERVAAGVDAEEVALTIEQLLDDPACRQQLHDGALRYASSWSVDDVASRLIDIARADSAAPATLPERISA